MHIQRLVIHQLRCFEALEIHLDTGLNLITGDNGTGKTTLLEAIHLMAYARSFRGRVRDGLIRTGAEALDVYIEWEESGQPGQLSRTRRAGLHHNGQKWKGRLDGEDVSQLGTLCAALAVVTFEPGSHSLVNGAAETRRRFIDWGLFHVEPDFLHLWRRYTRALKQRNALLKRGDPPESLDAWDHELADTGEILTSRRLHYLERLQALAINICADIAPNLKITALDFSPGWRRHELSLADALLLARERDRFYGYTSVGPHRADWSASFAQIPGREALSRGQGKLTALSCLLAQAEDFATIRGEWPVIALDDLGAELDQQHQQRLLQRLTALPAQVLITESNGIQRLANLPPNASQFHVEHAAVQRLA